MNIYPTEARDFQNFRGQNRPVGNHHPQIGLELAQVLHSLWVISQTVRLVKLEAGRLGALGHRGGIELTSSTTRCVGTGQHREDLVTGFQQIFQTGKRHLRGTGKD